MITAGELKLNILVIDTATKIELIAVTDGKRCSSSAEPVRDSHSKTIFNNIGNRLEEIGLKINDITLIGVGLGPGSFTGIRIAVSTARMISQILKTPLVGIKTQIIYAASVMAGKDDNILVAFDAKKNRVFGALYKKDVSSVWPVEIIPPGDYHIDFLLDKIDTNKTYSAGDGAEKYIEEISGRLGKHEFIPDFQPSGEIAAELIFQMYRENPGKYKNIHGVVPYYGRKSDAEIMKMDRSNFHGKDS